MFFLVAQARARMAREKIFALGAPAILWQVLFFYLPLLLTVSLSVVRLSELGSLKQLTLAHFAYLIHPTYFAILCSSLGLSLLTALGSLLIAYPLAYFIAFQPTLKKNLFLILLILPFWANFLLHVYSWFFLLQRQGFLNYALQALGLIHHPIAFLNSFFSIALVMIYHYLPFMALPIFSSLERFDRGLLEASRNLGASWKQTVFHIMLPLTLPAIRTGFFIVFISSFGEFIIPELMGGNKFYFAGSVISHYILGNATQGIGAAFMVISCATLALASWGMMRLFAFLTAALTKQKEL